MWDFLQKSGELFSHLKQNRSVMPLFNRQYATV